ncbi:TetR/AcrR family transcriptional regulator [Streptosporangium sandarakinum]|uniref:AcrR family transcriptional regulator n=1 Tax=Streptosporangium sandarakinum TaxID=1260955 RepID=A0A852US01_9ACTN|nr:TetR family transcriptional regulator [Streptosporangium sandarakinum]NYF38206.1 AcrR family transcriptional regulator [Streptosporangium sandarakinum]
MIAEEKRAQRRAHIADAAMRLFTERGFDAVTVNEVAEAAGVVKATLFNYFPTKESLVLHVLDDDLARVVAERAPGRTPLRALREHYRGAVAEPAGSYVPELRTMVRVIQQSPALIAGVSRFRGEQAAALVKALVEAGEPDGMRVRLMAAHIVTAVSTVQETFFQRLTDGMSPPAAGRLVGGDLDLAFDLLERVFGGEEK